MMKNLILLSILFFLSSCSSYEVQRDPIFEETKVRNARPKLDTEVFDIKESKPEYEQAFVDADLIAERQVRHVKRDRRFILKFWQQKKKVLQRKYGISWNSPAELNPTICYKSYGQRCIAISEKTTLNRILEDYKVSPGEVVTAYYRDFEGFVYVVTQESSFYNTTREYKFIGQKDQWEMLSVFEIE